MESMGLTQGSALVATPAEVAEQEAAEHARIEAANAALDASLAAGWACRICGGDAALRSSGCCVDCDRVALTLQAEQAAAHKIGGQTRRQLVQRYLDSSGGPT
jgi:hypothetical protein